LLRFHESGWVLGDSYLPPIKSFLQAQVERLDEATWLELAAKLGQLGRWEFEDYTP